MKGVESNDVAIALSISSHRRSDRRIFPQSAICFKQQRFTMAIQPSLPLTSHSGKATEI